jgi:hypothetical protein
MRPAFVQVVVNALRGKPVSGASVREGATLVPAARRRPRGEIRLMFVCYAARCGPENRQSARHRGAAYVIRHRRRGHRMIHRRDFITLLGGAAMLELYQTSRI